FNHPPFTSSTEISRLYPNAQFPKNSQGYGYASVGSKLYCFGGVCYVEHEKGVITGVYGKKDVWVVHSKTPHLGSSKHSSAMLVARMTPTTITACKLKPKSDGKLNIHTIVISVQSYIFDDYIIYESVGSFSLSKPPSESSSSFLYDARIAQASEIY
ncbi:hypothetical protein FRX31_007235, partial [Thalictrum thalictroides]